MSHDLFGCQIKDCSATLNIMGRYPRPTGSLIGSFLPFCRGAVGVFYSPSQLGELEYCEESLKAEETSCQSKLVLNDTS